jgi:hypothetical protein
MATRGTITEIIYVYYARTVIHLLHTSEILIKETVGVGG